MAVPLTEDQKNGAERATLVADFRAALQGWADPVAYGVGHDGSLWAAAPTSTPPAFQRRGAGSEPPRGRPHRRSRPSRRPADRSGSGTPLHRLPCVAHPGGFLLVASITRSGGAPERNALVVDRQGEVTRSLTIGDGVRDVRVAASGEIWVAYTAEGIFTAVGPPPLRTPGPAKPGAPGLVRFGADGEVRSRFDPTAAGNDPIDSVFALNVTSSGEVWLYLSPAFPIVRIDADGGYRSWPQIVLCARAIAVRDQTVLLLAHYNQQSVARIVSLEGSQPRLLGEFHVADQDGGCLDSASVFGNGETLFFFKERRAFAFLMEPVLDARRSHQRCL